MYLLGNLPFFKIHVNCFMAGQDSPCASSVLSLSCVWLLATPWTAAHQASLSITNSRSLLRLMSIESVMPSNHLILCRPLLLPPSVFPSIRVSSNESVPCITCPVGASASAPVLLSGECIIYLVLSHHNKNLKRQTLKPSACHKSRTVLQLHVTAQFYLENKGKYILEVWGYADPKDTKRRVRERERERVRAHTGERHPQPFGSSFYVFSSPWARPV